MWQNFKNLIFGKPALEKEHIFFGKMLFMGEGVPNENDYWESKISILEKQEPIEIFINTSISGPSENQVKFCKDAISNLDELFDRCWPIFEPDFEQWTYKKYTGNWRDSFEIMSIEIPLNADVKNEWSVCYYVDDAKHYFTAKFINGKPTYNEIDG